MPPEIELIFIVEKHNTLITINCRGIKLQTTPRDGTEHGEGESDAKGTGIYRTRRHHPGLAGDWDAGQGRQGRGAGVHMVEACRERKGTLDGITLGTTGT